MELFGRSLTDLRKKLALLEAAVVARSRELAAARTPAEHYSRELLPLTLPKLIVGWRVS